MALLYAPASAVLSLGYPLRSETITVPSVTWSGKPVAPRRWSQLWKTVPWIRRLSGTTYTPSEADAIEAAWIASLLDSRVSRGARAGRNLESKTSGGSGRPSGDSFATCDRQSSSWKTSRPSLFAADSDLFSGPWPYSGLMWRGICFARATSAPRTSAVGSLSWASPTAMNASGNGYQYSSGDHDKPVLTLVGQSQEWQTPNAGLFNSRRQPGKTDREDLLGGQAMHWPSPRAEDSESCGNHPDAHDSLTGVTRLWPTPNTPNGGRKLKPGTSLTGQTPDGHKRQVGLENTAEWWATPLAHDCHQASFFATPTSRDHEGSDLKSRHGGASLSHQVETGEMSHSSRQAQPTSTGGDKFSPHAQISHPRSLDAKRLNPAFVAWLMGFPHGLISCEPQAAALFRSKQRQHLWSLLGAWGCVLGESA